MYEGWPDGGAYMVLSDGGHQVCDPDAPSGESSRREYRLPTIESLLVTSWGSSPEATLAKLPEFVSRTPSEVCKSSDGIETCFVYIHGRLASIEFRIKGQVDLLGSIYKELGRADTVTSEVSRVIYGWHREPYDVTLVQQQAAEEIGRGAGHTILLMYRDPRRSAEGP